MLATFRVQHHNDTNITEFVTYERDSVYHLITILESNVGVQAYTIIAEGEAVSNPHMTYSFHQSIKMPKYTSDEFKW